MCIKINVMLQAVSPQYDAIALCCRKKRACPKNVSSALTIDSIQNVISICDEDDDDDEDTNVHSTVAWIFLGERVGILEGSNAKLISIVSSDYLKLHLVFIFNIFITIDAVQINSKSLAFHYA